MRLRFSIRDLLWLAVVVALVISHPERFDRSVTCDYGFAWVSIIFKSQTRIVPSAMEAATNLPDFEN